MKKSKSMAILFCILLLTGCKAPVETVAVQKNQNENLISMEEEAQLSYEVPISTPGILINQLGYMSGSTKVAVFRGKEVPDVFYVVDAESGEIVFTGYPTEPENNGGSDEYNSYGDFTQLQTEGTYYIKAPVLGHSYSFSIGNEIYDDIFKEAGKQYYYNRCGMTLTEEYAGEQAHNACHTGKTQLREDSSVSLDVTGGWHQDEKGQKDVASAAQAISVMLLAYELHPEAFTDDTGIPESGNGVPDLLDEIKYEVEWLLKMQNRETGAVYAGVTIYAQNGTGQGKTADSYVEPATARSEAAFAMALAKFSYLYQSFDTEYAINCLKAADRAWKHAGLHEKDAADDKWKFAAAAELYRAAGEQSYHSYIREYLVTGEYRQEKNEVILLGCVTYISTKQEVRVELCEKIMEMLMDRAEDISRTAKASVYLAQGNAKQDNNNQLLLEMLYLTVVNHVISNHEYETVIENHLHYFMGRNDKAVSYIDGAGEKSYQTQEGSVGIMKQFDADSKLLLMLSGILENADR